MRCREPVVIELSALEFFSGIALLLCSPFVVFLYTILAAGVCWVLCSVAYGLIVAAVWLVNAVYDAVLWCAGPCTFRRGYTPLFADAPSLLVV